MDGHATRGLLAPSSTGCLRQANVRRVLTLEDLDFQVAGIMLPMNLIVPFAAPQSTPAQEVLRGLPLPNLRSLLRRMGPPLQDVGDEWSLTPPHERAWARAMGWQGLHDGLVPKAAWMAHQQGLCSAGSTGGWGLLTLTHWRLGTEQVSLSDPEALQLEMPESLAYLEAIRELFESEGFSLWALAPTRWLCRHDQLADLPVASLDRVIGRNVDRWLGADPRARLIRRLQNEVQMLLRIARAVADQQLLAQWLRATAAGAGRSSGQRCSDLRRPAACSAGRRCPSLGTGPSSVRCPGADDLAGRSRQHRARQPHPVR
jgi:hypothetical protein